MINFQGAHIGVYSGPVNQTIVECALKLKELLLYLEGIDTTFLKWHPHGYLRKTGSERVVKTDIDSLIYILNENRGKDDYGNLTDSGTRYAFLCQVGKANYLELSGHCGSPSKYLKNTSIFEYSTGDQMPIAILNPNFAIYLLEKLVDIWNPDEGRIVIDNFYFDLPNKISLGSIGYLSHDTIKRIGLPGQYDFVKQTDMGIYLVSKDRPIDIPESFLE